MTLIETTYRENRGETEVPQKGKGVRKETIYF